MNEDFFKPEEKDVWRTKMNRAEKRKRYRLTKKKGKVYASIFTHKIVDGERVRQDDPPMSAHVIQQTWKLEKLRRWNERQGYFEDEERRNFDDHQLLEMS